MDVARDEGSTGYPETDWQVPNYDCRFYHGQTKRYALVIPVINEGDRIQTLCARMADVGTPALVDVILADGGSSDGSLEALGEHAALRGVLIKRSPGRLSAQLRMAYAFALRQGYEGVVTMDGNGKDDPAEVERFIAALERGMDFVQGSRFLPGGEGVNTPASREWAIRLVHAPVLSLSARFRWTDTTQGYRGYSSELLRSPRLKIFRSVFSGYELLAYLSAKAPKVGFKCCEVPTTRTYPKGEVPTKIKGIQGNLALLKVLFSAALGAFDPA